MTDANHYEPAYRFLSADEYVELPDEQETWLIHPLIAAGGWVNIYGKPKKARKSYLALSAAWAISSGQARWLDSFDVRSHGPVLFVQADTPRPFWKQRVRDIMSGGYDLSNVYIADLYDLPRQFDITKHADILSAMIEEVPESVAVIYDTSRKLHVGDENSSLDMTLLMNAISETAGLDRAKILISHDKKGHAPDGSGSQADDSEGGDLMDGSRGSTAVAGGVDAVIKLTPKGWMHYQSRAVGEEHKHLSFNHVHNAKYPCPHKSPRDCMGWMWGLDTPPEIEEAKKLLTTYKTGSERSLARMLATACDMDEERARSIIRRQKKEMT